MLKSYGWWGGGGGGPWDFSVRPSPFGLDFGTLDSDLGLTICLLLQTSKRILKLVPTFTCGFIITVQVYTIYTIELVPSWKLKVDI